MKNELFEALFEFLQETPDLEEAARKSLVQSLPLPFEEEKAQKVVACKHCQKMIPMIQYEYEITQRIDDIPRHYIPALERELYLTSRCPSCKEVQEKRLIRKELTGFGNVH